MVKPTQWDLRRAGIALGLLRFVPFLRQRVAEHIAYARREFAILVAATADEFGDDLESSACRLGGLLSAEFSNEDPSTFGRFCAPEEEWEEPTEGTWHAIQVSVDGDQQTVSVDGKRFVPAHTTPEPGRVCPRCDGTGRAPRIRGDRVVPGETMDCPGCLDGLGGKDSA